jgi:proline racemase
VPTTRIHTIDAHVAGQPVRLIVKGLRAMQGATIAEQQAWAARRLDRVRRALMREPRGHRDMTGALLTAPGSDTAQAGVLFMHHDGWRPLSLHALMAVATIAIERGLIMMGAEPDSVTTLTFDTASGAVPVRVERGVGDSRHGPGVSRVAVRGLPAFVLQPAVTVKLPSRSMKLDIAFGGAFYAIVDGEAAAVPLVRERFAELRALTRQIVASVERQHAIVHPQQPAVAGLAGVIFTGPARGETSDLRSLVVYADGAVDRSPGGTATAAVMAVVDAMALLGDDRPFVQEGPIGTCFTGRVVERLDIAGFPAIVPEITGQAWITGEHTFLLDPTDPLRDGFDL